MYLHLKLKFIVRKSQKQSIITCIKVAKSIYYAFFLLKTVYDYTAAITQITCPVVTTYNSSINIIYFYNLPGN